MNHYEGDDDLITAEEEKYYSADISPEDLKSLKDLKNFRDFDRAAGPEDRRASEAVAGYGEPDMDAEIDRAMARRARKRRKERRTRNIFITILVVLLLAVICFAYAAVLVPQDTDLPWPAFLGARPEKVPQVLSFLDRKPGDGAITIVDTEKETQAETGGSAAAEAGSADDGAAAEAGSADDGAAEDGSADGGAPAAEDTSEAAPPAKAQTAVSDTYADTVAQAQLLAQMYDYDGAIGLLQGIPDYQTDQTITDAISQYQAAKDSCVAVDVNTVPHIFYHSLVNDPSRAFDPDVMGQGQADGFNAWMVTTDEFDQITQRLYDAGYVYVRLRDLVVETKDEDGTPHFAPNTSLMLPEGKKAIVLSVDDLSYYHSYEPAGYPDKLVLDDQGQVKCHMTDAAGQESLGDYDVVPRLNTFLARHPDGCYKGARGLIALTGYNGVFGYRTDTDYVKKEHLMEDQAAWLAAHPDYNFDQEVADAKKIAEALKSEGWEFASHTWGHLSVTDKTADELKADNEKWVATVQPIVGPTDTIIFAHGNDIGDWEGYKDDNDKYDYYSSAGYHFFCNVDGSVPNWVQITDRYVRQGRIDVDGYRLWLCMNGEDTSLSQLIDTSGIFNSQRPTPVVANGQS